MGKKKSSSPCQMMPKEKIQLNNWARGFNRSRVLSAEKVLLLESAFYRYQTAETVPCPKEELTHFQSVWKCQRMFSVYHCLFSIWVLVWMTGLWQKRSSGDTSPPAGRSLISQSCGKVPRSGPLTK